MTVMDLRVSKHAAERYVERVRPGMTIEQATAEIERLLPMCEKLDERHVPPWVHYIPGQPKSTHFWMLLGDVVFPVTGCVVQTCLVKGTIPDPTRASRNKARAYRTRRKSHHRLNGGL